MKIRWNTFNCLNLWISISLLAQMTYACQTSVNGGKDNEQNRETTDAMPSHPEPKSDKDEMSSGTAMPHDIGSSSGNDAHGTPSMPESGMGYDSVSGTYRFATVVSDVPQCSTIGTEILGRKQGSAVDAAIATGFCVGIYHLHSSGIGGGHFSTIYATPRNGTEKELITLTAREKAPAAATPNMFVNNPRLALEGGLSVAVPGEIKGYYEAWKRFGRLPWRELVQPAIRLSRDGVTVRPNLLENINDLLPIYSGHHEVSPVDPSQSYLRTSNYSILPLITRSGGSPLLITDIIRRPLLAKTLERIADDPESFYTGSLAQDIADDLRDIGGIITLNDLRNYQVAWKPPVRVHLENGNLDVYGPPPPSSAVVTEAILNILDEYNWKPRDVATLENKVLSYHRYIEALKFGFAIGWAWGMISMLMCLCLLRHWSLKNSPEEYETRSTTI